MSKTLVVVRPFAEFVKGEHITDPADVAKFSASHAVFVRVLATSEVKTASPELPAA